MRVVIGKLGRSAGLQPAAATFACTPPQSPQRPPPIVAAADSKFAPTPGHSRTDLIRRGSKYSPSPAVRFPPHDGTEGSTEGNEDRKRSSVPPSLRESTGQPKGRIFSSWLTRGGPPSPRPSPPGEGARCGSLSQSTPSATFDSGSNAEGNVQPPWTLAALPLLGGEGRGEGERDPTTVVSLYRKGGQSWVAWHGWFC